MRITAYFLIGWMLLQGKSLVAQDHWGDYYFINQHYAKAVDHYQRDSVNLSLAQQRNYAQSLWALGQKSAAMRAYTPVANSNEARVEDYYRYADLLKGQKALAEEYRQKAYRLAWETPSLWANDSLLFKKRFGKRPYRIEGAAFNSPGNEFGAQQIVVNGQGKILFVADQQSEMQRRKRRQRVLSDFPLYNIYQTENMGQSTAVPSVQPLHSSVNTIFQEGPFAYSATDGHLYFTRSNRAYDKNKTIQLGIYRILYKDIPLSVVPVRLPLGGAEYSVMHPTLNAAGNQIIFASDRPGGYGGMDLYRSSLKNGEWTTPENLGPDINTQGDEVSPFWLSEQHLFFSSNGREGRGGLDIFLAEHQVEKRWESFVLGQGINSIADDFSFGLYPEEGEAFFSSNRTGGKGGDDVYRFDFTPEIMGLSDAYVYVPSDTLVIGHNHVLKNDMLALHEKDPLTRVLTPEAELSVAPVHGKITFNPNGSFLYKNTAYEQIKDSFAYRLTTSKGNSPLVWVQLNRAKVDAKALDNELTQTFAPIFYATDQSSIQSAFIRRVDRVVTAMNNNPQLTIEVRSYTDCTGQAAYNLALSKRRTKVILDYVRARIQRPGRIFGDGYGPYPMENSIPYALVAGSFKENSNAKRLLQSILTYFPTAFIAKNEDNYRVIVSRQKDKSQLTLLQEQLSALGISSWIIDQYCAMGEDELQESRRTDFEVIRL